MDLNYFVKTWQRSMKNNTGKCDEKYWDGIADCINAWEVEEPKPAEHDIIDFLQTKGIFKPSYSVLDIGCGSGRQVIKFAENAKCVVGTDISGRILTYAAENVNKAGLSNVSFLKADWQDVDLRELNWEKKFDLVFSSMSPAISNKNGLDRMIKASKGYCVFCYPMKKLTGFCLLLSQLLNVKGNYDPEDVVYCLFNILYLAGYNPEINYKETKWKLHKPLDEAAVHYSRMLAIPGGVSDEQLALIKGFLLEKAKNNFIDEIITSNVAWISWRVEE